MMLGYLLARAGVDVLVLEKHADFLRDFRGDTIHPSTLELMYELGLLEEFLKRPHQEVLELGGHVGSESVIIADFRHVPTHCKFLAMMPQWDFLDFLSGEAKRYTNFHLRMQAEVTGLIEENGVITGVRAKTQDGELLVKAGLVVGADGRQSVVRERASLRVRSLGAPIDVMWMRVSRKRTDPGQTFGRVDAGHILVLLDREEYWQLAFVIRKGYADVVREKGLDAFRRQIAAVASFLSDRVDELQSWDQIKLLTVMVDRLEKWSRAGLLCIGDAAHAMSPIGGVGINLAIQDAVAAANILGENLRQRTPTETELQRVQRRRMFPTRATQRLQVAIQDNVLKRVLETGKQVKLPWALRLLRYFPALRRIPARIVGVGFRPEHIRVR